MRCKAQLPHCKVLRPAVRTRTRLPVCGTGHQLDRGARVVRDGYPDFTSWDSDGKYFDEKSTPENPRWFMVDIEPVMELPMVSLHDMKENPNLEGMPLLQRGQRLSVQPVSPEHFDEVLRMVNANRSDFE